MNHKKSHDQLCDLLLSKGEWVEVDLGAPWPTKVMKPKRSVQLWHAPAIGFQFAGAFNVSFGPIAPVDDHAPLLHVNYVGVIEEDVGRVISASSRFSVYGMARGGGEINVEIRNYHIDFVRRIHEVHWLHDGDKRDVAKFGFSTLGP